jgi:hypothetical protein
MWLNRYKALPPTRRQSSRRVAPAEALGLVSAYLEDATTDFSLRPNAQLTDDGPIAAMAGSETNLVLHNLRRVEAGLQGRHLRRDPPSANSTGPGWAGAEQDAGSEGGATPGGGADGEMGGGGWQDKAEFEREQEIVQGEVGIRNYAEVDGVAGGVDVPRVAMGIDKDARKRNKAERRKKEQRKKERQKQNGKAEL